MSGSANDSSDTDRSESEIDLLEIAREEAHRTVDYQVETLNDIDTKAAKVLRLNLLLLGIVLTGLSLVANNADSGGAIDSSVFRRLGNVYVELGLLCLLVSTALAALTYTASSMREGMSGRDINDLLTNEYSDRENLYGIVDSYSRWMQYNFKINTRNAPLGTSTLLFLVYGIVALSLGVFEAAFASVTVVHVLVALISVGVFTWRTGIVGQIQRYRKYKDLDVSED
jgi:hypothetical protein